MVSVLSPIPTSLLPGALVLVALAAPLFAQDEVSRQLEIDYSDEWVAERHGTRITLTDVLGRLSDIPEDRRAAFLASPERVARIINDLLFNYAMAENAIERGVLEDPEVLGEIYYRTMYMLARREQQAIIAENELDDYADQAEEYYLANLDEFDAPDRYTFTHILLRVPRSTVGDRDAARSAMEGLYAEIQAGRDIDGIDLEAWDGEGYRIGRSSVDDVLLDDLDDRVAEGLRDLEPGEHAVVESNFGFHAIRLDRRESGGTLPFEEVAGQLEQQARQRHHDQILRQRLEAFYADELKLADGAVERIIESQRDSQADADD